MEEALLNRVAHARLDKGSAICRLLDELTPGDLPPDVFHSIARLMVTVTYVVVPLLKREGRTLALLHRRDQNDLSYPAMLNTPGTVIRASDENLPAVYDRLVAKEMVGLTVKRGPIFVGNVYDQIVRGREVSLIHWVELDVSLVSKELYDVHGLPDYVVPTDRPRIQMAAAHFEAYLNS